MQKRKSCILFVFLATLLAITFFTKSPVEASNEVDERELDISIKNYEELIQKGILSNDIDYETWIEINKQAKKEEAIYLEKNKTHLQEHKDPNINSKKDSVRTGDILISNGTSFNGFTGHVGIAVSSNEVLHTANKNSVPEVISLNKWIETYGLEAPDEGFIPTNTEVYRFENADQPLWAGYPEKAAEWARRTYENSGYEYEITTDLFSTNPTYCSKIVWQAYYYAGGQWGPRFMDIPKTNIPTPYGMPTYFKNGWELELITII